MFFSMDYMFHSFVLPDVFVNELDYSRSTPIDAQQAKEISVHLQHTVNATKEHIRKLNIRFVRFDLMDDVSFNAVVASIARMEHLCSIRVQQSELSEPRIIALLYTVLNLPHMQGHCTEYTTMPSKHTHSSNVEMPLGSEVILKGLEITDELLTKLSTCIQDPYDRKIVAVAHMQRKQHPNGRLVEHPAKGVRKLVLSDNKLTDKGIKVVVNLFPHLTELHMAGNRSVSGLYYHCMITKRLPMMHFLNADCTGIDDTGVHGIHQGMRDRLTTGSAQDVVPLQVCLRGMQCNESWVPLLDFCAEARSAYDRLDKRFLVKHDLIRGPEHMNCNLCVLHDEINVAVFIHGVPRFDVKHCDTVSTKSVKNIAELCMLHINTIIIEECTGITGRSNRSATNLRHRYRTAMLPLLQADKLIGRVYRIDSVRLKAKNKFTGELITEDGMTTKVVGIPLPGWELSVEVAVEEEEGGMECLAKMRRR